MPLICFASPNGGVGRTTLAANLAAMLSRGGRSVIALGLHFGLDPADPYGLMSVLRYVADARESWRATIREAAPGLGYLPFGTVGLDGANALSAALAHSPDMLTAVVRDMLADTGLTIVADIPSGPSSTLAAILPLATLMLVPVLPTPISMAQLPALEREQDEADPGSGWLGSFPSRQVALILNQIDAGTRLGRAIGDAASARLGARLIGTIRYDELVPEAMAAQKLVTDLPEGAAARDLSSLASAVDGRLNGSGDPIADCPPDPGHGNRAGSE